MTHPSPYQPPRGAITPATPARYGEIRLFSPGGRLGRVRYIGYSVGLGLLINLLGVGWGGALAALAGGGETELLALGGSLLLIALAVTLSILLSIQRLHDFDASGWWSALNLVPLANLALYLVLLIMPGTRGANRFGDPTPPNTAGVILLALVVPMVAVIGIVAAIAIPAYQDYAERARAASQNAPAPSQ
jgi:uncharacterized membrane protein YhaH (DUF805 family)